MEKLQCQNCGGHLIDIGYGHYKCEYCGTEYKKNDSPYIPHMLVQTIAPPCLTVEAKAIMDDYLIYANPEMASEMVVRKLSDSLAEAIKEHMVVRSERDPVTQQMLYRGRIRFLDENYRFS